MRPGYSRNEEIEYLEWSPDGEIVGLYSNFAYYIWKYKQWNTNQQFTADRQIDEFSVAFPGFHRLYTSPENPTDVSWSGTGDYIAQSYLIERNEDLMNKPLIIRNTSTFSHHIDDGGFSQFDIDVDLTALAWVNHANKLYIGTSNGSIFVWERNSEPTRLMGSINGLEPIEGMWINHNSTKLAIEHLMNNLYTLRVHDFNTMTVLDEYQLSSPLKRFFWFDNNVHVEYGLLSQNNDTVYVKRTTGEMVTIPHGMQDVTGIDFTGNGNQLWIADGKTIGHYSISYTEDNIELTSFPPIDLPPPGDATLDTNQIVDVRISPDNSMIVHNIGNSLVIRDSVSLEILYFLPGDYYTFSYDKYFTKDLFNTMVFLGLTPIFLTLELILIVINHKRQEKNINPDLYPSLNQAK